METIIASVLERLLMTSVQTALLAAGVWLLCRALPRLSPATQCWLWWLVALQVLVGLCVPAVRLPWLPEAPATVAQALPVAQVLSGAGDVAALPAAGSLGLPLWQIAILLVWVAGLALMIGAALREWRRSVALLRDSAPCTDHMIARAVGDAAARRGLHAMPRLVMSGEVDSPLVVGQLRPVLVLPLHSPLSARELEMAVDHELEHLRRDDMLWGWVPVLARLAFFFHPLVHLAVREYGIAREAACDAAVVAVEHRSRHDYGELLVRLGTGNRGVGLAAASRTFLALNRRLTLLQHAKYLPRAGSIAVLLIALAGVLPLRLVSAAQPQAATALVGEWILVRSDRPGNPSGIGIRRKIFTATTVSMVQRDPATGVVVFEHGGDYTLHDTAYTETVTHAGPSTAQLIGQTFKYRVIVTGDTYTQEGETWNETWRRAPPAK